MTVLRTAVYRLRATRARLRADRAIRQAIAGAPTIESAHDLVALTARR